MRTFFFTTGEGGIPLTIVWGQTTPKLAKKAKAGLDDRFAEIGGNAMSRDKKGRVKQDDSSMQQEMAGAGLGGDQGFEPYVFYDFEIV
jgi:V-type H+-transporting ATPase subunit C